MKRAIITPPDLSAQPLDDLKQWLAITVSQEDNALIGLLHSSLDLCEAFTGQMPLMADCEEVLTVLARWQKLSAKPVVAITSVEAVPSDGERYLLGTNDYEIDINADGEGCVRILRSIGETRIAVRYTAGHAADWSELPEAIRHGAIRFAAASYRSRGEESVISTMPSAVAALWQPWRQVRLT